MTDGSRYLLCIDVTGGQNDSAKVESVINLFEVQSSFHFNGEGRSGYAFDW